MTQGIHKAYGNLLFDTENTGELKGDLVESHEGSNGAKTWALTFAVELNSTMARPSMQMMSSPRSIITVANLPNLLPRDFFQESVIFEKAVKPGHFRTEFRKWRFPLFIV